VHNPDEVPNLPEGSPTTKAVAEGCSAVFDPNGPQVSAPGYDLRGSPMTNIVTAIICDPQFASLAQELVIMGGRVSLSRED